MAEAVVKAAATSPVLTQKKIDGAPVLHCETMARARNSIALSDAASDVTGRDVMRLVYRLSVAVAVMLLSASCVSGPPLTHEALSCAPITAGPTVEEVRRLELRGGAVNVEGWGIEEARAFFAPEWASIQPDGSVTRLETVLGAFVDGRSRGWASSFTLVELDIRVACDNAVVIGLAEARPLGAPQSSPPVRMRFLNVWRREDGRWLYAANQWTSVPQAP